MYMRIVKMSEQVSECNTFHLFVLHRYLSMMGWLTHHAQRARDTKMIQISCQKNVSVSWLHRCLNFQKLTFNVTGFSDIHLMP